jgi:hypothetical protein
LEGIAARSVIQPLGNHYSNLRNETSTQGNLLSKQSFKTPISMMAGRPTSTNTSQQEHRPSSLWLHYD